MIPDSLLPGLMEYLTDHIGLSFPQGRKDELHRGIASAAQEYGFEDAEPFVTWLVSSVPDQRLVEVLASYLTVGETYFFRDRSCLERLELEIFPELIATKRLHGRCLRIWSAGCCTGEEPYSIAILLSKLLPDIDDWNVKILATDINPGFLDKAREGRYRQWSFRDTPEWVKTKCFTMTPDGEYEILPRFREMVTFSYHNLGMDPFPSLLNGTNAMDLVLCRNVLMYFTEDKTREVIDGFYRCLVEGGWFSTSPAESSHVLFSQYETAAGPGSIMYRKSMVPYREVLPETRPAVLLPAAHTETIQVPEEPTLLESAVPRAKPLVRGKSRPPVTAAPAARGDVSPEKDRGAGEDPIAVALGMFEKGMYGEAALLLEGAQGRERDARALSMIARAHANQGKLTEALAWSQKAVAAERTDPRLHFLNATILQELGMTVEAAESLRKALYLDQDFVVAHFALGNIMRETGDEPGARKQFDNALELLGRFDDGEAVPESEGVTAGRLSEVIAAQGGVVLDAR